MFRFRDEHEYRDFIRREIVGPTPPAPVPESKSETEILLSTQDRFYVRQEIFREAGVPLIIHHFWWVVHNCVAHIGIGLLPCQPTFWFHDYTSRKLMNA